MRGIILVSCVILVFVLGLMIGEGLPGGKFISANPSISYNDPETGGTRTGIVVMRKQLIPAIVLTQYEYKNLLGRNVKFWFPAISSERRIGIGIDNWDEFCPLIHIPKDNISYE